MGKHSAFLAMEMHVPDHYMIEITMGVRVDVHLPKYLIIWSGYYQFDTMVSPSNPSYFFFDSLFSKLFFSDFSKYPNTYILPPGAYF